MRRPTRQMDCLGVEVVGMQPKQGMNKAMGKFTSFSKTATLSTIALLCNIVCSYDIVTIVHYLMLETLFPWRRKSFKIWCDELLQNYTSLGWSVACSFAYGKRCGE